MPMNDYANGNISKNFVLRIAITTTAVGANTTVERTFSVPGLLPGDVVTINKPTQQAGLGIVGVRATTDTLAITFSNNTGAGITPTAGELYLVQVDRPNSDLASIPTAIV